MIASRFSTRSLIIGLLFVLAALRLGAAYFLPVFQDEAYYLEWTRHLAFGYLDHPPAVAFVLSAYHFISSSLMVARIGTFIISVVFFGVTYRWLQRLGIRDQSSLIVAMVLANGNLLILGLGFITTPDSLLLLCWLLALNEGQKALDGKGHRWLSAGLVTGLGLLSKYTMVLMGPVFLWGLVRVNPRQLKTPWPYLGGAIALLIFMPNLIWNKNHDWATFNFQLRHGFTLEQKDLNGSDLPVAEMPLEHDPESSLARALWRWEDEMDGKLSDAEQLSYKKSKAEKSPLERSWQYASEFILACLALWGALTLGIAGSLIDFKRKKFQKRSALTDIRVSAKPLLYAACFFPIVFFGVISLISKVEGNWAGMYLIAASPLLAMYLDRHLKVIIYTFVLNLVILAVLVLHTRIPLQQNRGSSDRILFETHGYDRLASEIVTKGKGMPLFTDIYQNAAMLRYYFPIGMKIRQWPGAGRPSEFTRNPIEQDLNRASLETAEYFHMIASREIPPKIPGFAARQMYQIRDCVGQDLEWIDIVSPSPPRCLKPVHKWYFLQYEKK